MTSVVRHGLSFDIEDYYQIVWKDYLGQSREPGIEVERNTSALLDALDEADVRATFFFLGNVARKYPGLVRRAAQAGHELGVHGFEHRYVTDMDAPQLRDDLRRAIHSIEDAGGTRVIGHRAAAFSIREDTLWALDVIAELGLRYDSSIFPFRGRRYGIAEYPIGIQRLSNGLYEVPLTVVECLGRRLPAVGGGYFRVFPFAYTRWALARLEAEGRSAVTYFHPHEFEGTKPRVPADGWTAAPIGALRLMKTNAGQGLGRGRRMWHKLRRLVREHRFVPVGDLLPMSTSHDGGTRHP